VRPLACSDTAVGLLAGRHPVTQPSPAPASPPTSSSCAAGQPHRGALNENAQRERPGAIGQQRASNRTAAAPAAAPAHVTAPHLAKGEVQCAVRRPARLDQQRGGLEQPRHTDLGAAQGRNRRERCLRRVTGESKGLKTGVAAAATRGGVWADATQLLRSVCACAVKPRGSPCHPARRGPTRSRPPPRRCG
jgi:hypothetical protein